MQQAAPESKYMNEPKLFENFRFPAEVAMIRFYCDIPKCSGSFITAFSERHAIENCDSNMCPKCGGHCSISKVRKIRPI